MLRPFHVGKASTSQDGPSDARVAGGLRPGQLSGVPLDERFGVGGDEEVFVEAGIGLADLGLAVFEQQAVPLVGPEAGEVEANDNALGGKAVRAERVAIDHSTTNGSRFSGAISSQRAPHSPRVWQTLNRSSPDVVSRYR
jgi:hypothetical protein